MQQPMHAGRGPEQADECKELHDECSEYKLEFRGANVSSKEVQHGHNLVDDDIKQDF